MLLLRKWEFQSFSYRFSPLFESFLDQKKKPWPLPPRAQCSSPAHIWVWSIAKIVATTCSITVPSLKLLPQSAQFSYFFCTIWLDYNWSADNLRTGHFNKLYIQARGTVTWHWSAVTLSWQLSIDHKISETKIDASFPNSMFHVEGFRLCRSDRKAGGWGLMVYVRPGVYFTSVKQFKGLSSENLPNFTTEQITLKGAVQYYLLLISTLFLKYLAKISFNPKMTQLSYSP